MRSSLRGKASKGGKGSKSGKGGMKRNASFGFLSGDGTADGINGRQRSMNVRPLSTQHVNPCAQFLIQQHTLLLLLCRHEHLAQADSPATRRASRVWVKHVRGVQGAGMLPAFGLLQVMLAVDTCALAAAALLKLKVGSLLSGALPMQEEEAIEAAAQDAVTTELHKRAAARAAWQLAARRSALEWLRHPLPVSTTDYVTDWLAVLHDALAALYPASAPAPGHEVCNGALAEADAAPRTGALSEHDRASEASDALPSNTEAPSSALASIADGYPSEDDVAGAAGAASEAGQTGADGAHLAPANGDLGRPGGPAGAALGENGGTSGVQPRGRPDPVALTEALDAIRELASLHVTLPLLASTEILPTLQKLTSHPVSSASRILMRQRLL